MSKAAGNGQLGLLVGTFYQDPSVVENLDVDQAVFGTHSSNIGAPF